MIAQEQAKRILAAWVTGSADGLKSELEGVLRTSHGAPVSIVEKEERELLESLASDLYAALERTQAPQRGRLQSSLALLQHLSDRSPESFLNKSWAA
jgi:hypothetical protein